MTFLSPMMLWLLLLAPAAVGLYVWLLRRRKKFALRYTDVGILRLAEGTHRWRRHVPAALLLAAFVLLIVAAARPAATVTLATRGGTIVMAIDVSGSMRAADVAPNRISAAQIAAKAFVDKRDKPIKIAVVAFSGNAFLVQAPTTDTAQLDKAIDGLQPQFTTAIGSAVATSLQTIFPGVQLSTMMPSLGLTFTSGPAEHNGRQSLDQHPSPPPPPPVPVAPGSYKSAAIVLMTDGRNTMGPDPVEVARVAANLGVRVYTIGFGTANGQMISFYGRAIRAMLDEDTLKRMASITAAEYFHATSATELTSIYQQLTTKLQKETETMEISSFFVAGAMVFAVAASVLSMIWYRRII
jgi:Ca-activated chloride channel family protein